MMRIVSGNGWRPNRAAWALLAAATAVLLLSQPPAAGALDPQAEKAAETYLRALLRGDRTSARRLSPSKPENKFGPCPFVEMPQLEGARVDAHRAAVLFKGRLQDEAVPGEGAIILTKLDEVEGNPWRVRQVGFFTALPLGARIPSRSVTRQDAAQEPLVLEAARRYLTAWLKGDYQTMEDLAFDWLAREGQRSQPINLRSIEFSGAPSEGGEIKITFTARITIYRVLPKTLNGTVFAMREDGQWKIRGNELTL